ncbi:hypothetical protein Tco_0635759 [Tanacetum coccineum]
MKIDSFDPTIRTDASRISSSDERRSYNAVEGAHVKYKVDKMLHIKEYQGKEAVADNQLPIFSMEEIIVMTESIMEPSFTAQTNRPPTPYPLVIQTQQPPILTPAMTTSSLQKQNLPNFATLFGLDYRRNVKRTTSQTQTNKTICMNRSSSIPGIQFLDSIDEGMKKIIKEQVKQEVYKITPKIEKLVTDQLEFEVLVRSSKEANTSPAVAQIFTELELKNILIDKMEAKQPINRPRDGADDDQEPSAGTDRGSRRRRSGKEPASIQCSQRRDDDVFYKFKEGDFHRLRIQDIEDMLLLLVQGKVTNLNVEERIAFNVSLRSFQRSVSSRGRVEDLQLGVESYQEAVRLRFSDPMIQPEPEGSTQGYPLDSVEVLRLFKMVVEVPDSSWLTRSITTCSYPTETNINDIMQLSVMSSTSSAVTYTSVYIDSEPGRVFWGADEELSDGGPEEPQTPPVPQDEDEREPMIIQPHDPDYMPEPIYPVYIPKLRVNTVRYLLINRLGKSSTAESKEIIDFLNANQIHYALTVNPTIYTSCIEQFWATAKAKTINCERQLQTLVDKKKVIITETSIKSDLYLEDAGGIDCLPTTTIFEELARMGAKTTAWNEFSSTMASAIICLSTNQKFNLSKYIFDDMVKHIEGGVKFFMYPRFVQVFLNKQLGDMSHHKKIYVNPSYTKKIFANMKREGKDFSSRVTPLFASMMVQANQEEGVDLGVPINSQQTPFTTQPSSSRPQKKQSRRKQRKETEVPHNETHHDDSVPIPSNDPLLSGEDRMQLTELMILCTNLQKQVLDLETAKDAQSKEIVGLKKRDAEVSSVDGNPGEISWDVFDEAKMFDTDDLNGVEVDCGFDSVTTAGKGVTTAIDELTLAKILLKSKQLNLKIKQHQLHQALQPSKTKDKGKAIMIEPEVPLKKKDQVALDEEMARNLEAELQAELIEEEKMARKKEEEANIALIESMENTQAMMEADRLLAERLLNKRAKWS